MSPSSSSSSPEASPGAIAVPDQLDDEAEALFEMLRSRHGFVPNSLRQMAHRPDILRVVTALSPAILGPGEIEPGLKRMVGLIASQAAGCRYCWAHTAYYASAKGDIDPEKVAAAWLFETDERFSERERAALRFALAGGSSPNCVRPEHFEELRRHFDEGQIVEIAAVISFYGFYNRWNDTMMSQLEPEHLEFGERHLGPSGWSPPTAPPTGS